MTNDVMSCHICHDLLPPCALFLSLDASGLDDSDQFLWFKAILYLLYCLCFRDGEGCLKHGLIVLVSSLIQA